MSEEDVDQEPLVEVLTELGLSVGVWSWDDSTLPFQRPLGADAPSAHVGWPSAKVSVLRSTWNYARAPVEFGDFLTRVAKVTRLENPLAIVQANLHKRYLLDLAAKKIPVIPTTLVEQGSGSRLKSLVPGADRVVVKPAISAGSYETILVDLRDATSLMNGQQHLDRLLRYGDVLVQPYMQSVETTGERANVWIDGEWTHAVRKERRLAGDQERVSDALPIDPADRELGDRALALLPVRPLYARVDVARDEQNRPMIMEVELIEPSLFLIQSPLALDRFAEAIAKRVDAIS